MIWFSVPPFISPQFYILSVKQLQTVTYLLADYIEHQASANDEEDMSREGKEVCREGVGGHRLPAGTYDVATYVTG